MGLDNISDDNVPDETLGGKNHSTTDVSAIWNHLDQVKGFDEPKTKKIFSNSIAEAYIKEDENRSNRNQKSHKIRILKYLMYNYFYFESAWKDKAGKWKFNDEEWLTDRAEDELIMVLNAYVAKEHPEEELDDVQYKWLEKEYQKIIDTTTDELNNTIGDDLLTEFGIVVEKRYTVVDMEGTPGGYDVAPHVRIEDIPQFEKFLKSIKESDSDLDDILTLILDGTTFRVNAYLSYDNCINPSVEQFLIAFKGIADHLSQIPHFFPDSNLQIKYYSLAAHGRYLPEYLKFIDLGFTGALEESIKYDPNHMPEFVSELFYTQNEGYNPDEVEGVIENFDDKMDDVVDLLKATKHPYLLKKMKAELSFSLEALQTKLHKEKNFIPHHRTQIDFLVTKYKDLI